MHRKTFPLIGSLLFAIVAVASLAISPSAALAGPTLRDDAGLFKPETVTQVNSIIKEIHEKFGKDLTIKTFATIPENMQASFNAEKKDEFYEHWLRQEARAAETNGVFILITKSPGHLQIGVGNQTHLKTFTYADRDELRDLMLKELREKKFDDGLLQGAQFVLARMEKNEGHPAGAPPKSDVEPAHAAAQTQPSAVPAPLTLPAADTQPGPTTRPSAQVPATKTATPEPDVKPAPSGVELNK